jgi:hypothetical protein
MFILNRQDVEITNVPHPQKKELQIPVLIYQRQTFGLLSMFGDNREEALLYWRDLVDNKGKLCILLEEPEIKRFSVWGKFVLGKDLIMAKSSERVVPEQTPPQQAAPKTTPLKQVIPEQTPPQKAAPKTTPLKQVVPEQTSLQKAAPKTTPLKQVVPEQTPPQKAAPKTTPLKQVAPKTIAPEQITPQLETPVAEVNFTQACLLILQTVYLEIVDLFGASQANLFKQDIVKILKKENFPQIDSIEALEKLLSGKNLMSWQAPYWNDSQLQLLLTNLYKIAQAHFGNTVFLEATRNAIADMSPDEKIKFQTWLTKMPNGQVWYK